MTPGSSRVLDDVPGQEHAMAFLKQAAVRPHHAYVLAGPEGGGKRLAMYAFAAALLCPDGGCGDCRACRLALKDHHANMFVVEPEGRGIPVDAIREKVWHNAHRTAPEPGRKIFLIREADRLTPEAADALLKVLEEPPADAVLLLSSARPDELPPTILSRCHTVTFQPLEESFVVQALVEGGAAPDQALLAARLTGGNIGRARRMTSRPDGLAFRDVARGALGLADEGSRGAVAAADLIIKAASDEKDIRKKDRKAELEPYKGARGDDSYRGEVTRIEARHKRLERRDEHDYLDSVLLAAASLLRDRVLVGVGGNPDIRLNLDLEPGHEPMERAAREIGYLEEARASLADETNLNAKLVLEHAFLRIAIGRVS